MVFGLVSLPPEVASLGSQLIRESSIALSCRKTNFWVGLLLYVELSVLHSRFAAENRRILSVDQRLSFINHRTTAQHVSSSLFAIAQATSQFRKVSRNQEIERRGIDLSSKDGSKTWKLCSGKRHAHGWQCLRSHRRIRSCQISQETLHILGLRPANSKKVYHGISRSSLNFLFLFALINGQL